MSGDRTGFGADGGWWWALTLSQLILLAMRCCLRVVHGAAPRVRACMWGRMWKDRYPGVLGPPDVPKRPKSNVLVVTSNKMYLKPIEMGNRDELEDVKWGESDGKRQKKVLHSHSIVARMYGPGLIMQAKSILGMLLRLNVYAPKSWSSSGYYITGIYSTNM